MVDLILGLLLALLVLVVVAVGPFAWLLRDGLGPDAVSSSGWQAVTRMFWTFYWGPTVVVLAALTAMAWLARARLRRGKRLSE